MKNICLSGYFSTAASKSKYPQSAKLDALSANLIQLQKTPRASAKRTSPQGEAWRGAALPTSIRRASFARPRMRFLRRERRRPEQIVATSQFEVDLPSANQSRLRRDASAQICDLRRCALRPEMPQAFQQKLLSCLSACRNPAVSEYNLQKSTQPHPIEMERSSISIDFFNFTFCSRRTIIT